MKWAKPFYINKRKKKNVGKYSKDKGIKGNTEKTGKGHTQLSCLQQAKIRFFIEYFF